MFAGQLNDLLSWSDIELFCRASLVPLTFKHSVKTETDDDAMVVRAVRPQVSRFEIDVFLLLPWSNLMWQQRRNSDVAAPTSHFRSLASANLNQSIHFITARCTGSFYRRHPGRWPGEKLEFLPSSFLQSLPRFKSN